MQLKTVHEVVLNIFKMITLYNHAQMSTLSLSFVLPDSSSFSYLFSYPGFGVNEATKEIIVAAVMMTVFKELCYRWF